MGRLGSHQHIVSLFDRGERERQPFLLTEPMGGGAVESLIEHASDQRVLLTLALTLGRELCRGLAFAHPTASCTSRAMKIQPARVMARSAIRR